MLRCQWCFFRRNTSRVHINAALKDSAVFKHHARSYNIAADIARFGDDHFLAGADITGYRAINVDDTGFIVDSNGQFLLGYPVDDDGAVANKTLDGANRL